jgi:hypothetical protein
MVLHKFGHTNPMLTENIQQDVELPQLKLKHNNQMHMASHDDLVNESRKL